LIAPQSVPLVAFPTGTDASPDDYAVYLACYTISTYLLPAFRAVGYLWLSGLESYVTRALLAIADDGYATTTTSMALSMVKKLYAEDHGEPPANEDGRGKRDEDSTPFGLDNVKKLGVLFKRMGVPKLPRQSKGFQYDLSAPVLTRLKALYLPTPPMNAPHASTSSAFTTPSTPNTPPDDVDRVESADAVEATVDRAEANHTSDDEAIPHWIKEMPGAADD